MEDTLNLDLEYKRYLEILRPYLGDLTNEKLLQICNAWIQRLSSCREAEKVIRNKYVFSLCYQLAKGVLEDPFLTFPPSSDLAPLTESIHSEDSSTEIECAVVDADDENAEILCNNRKPRLVSDTKVCSKGNDKYPKTESLYDCDTKSFTKINFSRRPTVLCYACPEMLNNSTNFSNNGEICDYRAKKLIQKLRDIKTENCKLHCELLSLRADSEVKNLDSNYETIKVDNATSVSLQSKDSSTTLKSLKCRLQEVQESRNGLIEEIALLQEQLDNKDSLQAHEIEEMETKYKLEIIRIKSSTKEELKYVYESKIETIKSNYESRIKEIENRCSSDIQDSKQINHTAIEELNNTISSKNTEIEQLKAQIDDLKNHLHSVLEKYINKPLDCYCEENMRSKAQQQEKRLIQMEKNKIKTTRCYEAKIVQLQREKNLAECSLQLHLVKQRAQVVNEVTDENHAELTAALDKLEGKYKEIVANVQTTAIQRRIQDQKAIESILQAACAIPNENTQLNSQLPKTIRHNQIYDNEISPLLHCNKGNKSFGEDSFVSGFNLNGERMGELFERVYIPHRDNSDGLK